MHDGWVIASLMLQAQLVGAGSPVPDWDMRSFCGARVAPSGIGECIAAQHEARDRVQRAWDGIGPQEKADCLAWLLDDELPPSYLRLDHCLGQIAKNR